MPKLPFLFFALLHLCVRHIHIFNQQRQKSNILIFRTTDELREIISVHLCFSVVKISNLCQSLL
jgi:hypothetical protein